MTMTKNAAIAARGAVREMRRQADRYDPKVRAEREAYAYGVEVGAYSCRVHGGIFGNGAEDGFREATARIREDDGAAAAAAFRRGFDVGWERQAREERAAYRRLEA